MAVVVTVGQHPELASLVSVSAMLEMVSVLQMVSLDLLREFTLVPHGTETLLTSELTIWALSSKPRVSMSSLDLLLDLSEEWPKVVATGKVSAMTPTLLAV